LCSQKEAEHGVRQLKIRDGALLQRANRHDVAGRAADHVLSKRLFSGPRVVMSVPSGVTETEKHSLINILLRTIASSK